MENKLFIINMNMLINHFIIASRAYSQQPTPWRYDWCSNWGAFCKKPVLIHTNSTRRQSDIKDTSSSSSQELQRDLLFTEKVGSYASREHRRITEGATSRSTSTRPPRRRSRTSSGPLPRSRPARPQEGELPSTLTRTDRKSVV